MKDNLTKPQARERIARLKESIDRYRYSYHVENKSLISDAALDSLKKELFDLEQKFPEYITPDSPTQRIGGMPIAKFKKVTHEIPLLSLNDAFTREDMTDWIERVENILKRKIKPEFYCELKIDGLAIELIYNDGVFAEGSTRGDGKIGEDVTQNLKTVEAIPLRLETRNSKREIPSRLVVRGEVFLNKKEFARINKEQEGLGKAMYANPRNITAGSIRQLDPKITASRKLDSFIYELKSDLGQNTHEEEHEILKRLGFKTNPHNKAVHSVEEIFKFRDYWEAHRDKLQYEVDGTVIIINDNKTAKEAGTIGKAPRYAIAYKFAAKEATTRIVDIRVQVGRTGVLTPVAELEPVEVGGVTISHATLHNYDEIKRLGVKIGDTVIISRAGDVIPKVTKVLKELRTGREKTVSMPTKCPVDGSRVVRDGVILRCTNSECGARHKESLYHFVSRAAFNLDGLGPKIIDKFLDEGLISDAADIFTLQKGDIEVLERFGEKSAQNIIDEIEKKKVITLPRFLFALGILHVGEETAILLAKEISNSQFSISKPKDVAKALERLNIEDLQNIRDIGPKVAESIYSWFREKRNLELLENLEKGGIKIKATLRQGSGQVSGKLKRKSFVLTGGLESMTRDEAKEKIRDAGGEVHESVSKKTDYVVAGSDPGSKYNKAKKLGVKTISEKEFLRLL